MAAAHVAFMETSPWHVGGILESIAEFLGSHEAGYAPLAQLALVSRQWCGALRQLRRCEAFRERPVPGAVPLAAWRRSWPGAVQCNISERGDVVSGDFRHLRGVVELNLSLCSQLALGDAAFSYLRGGAARSAAATADAHADARPSSMSVSSGPFGAAGAGAAGASTARALGGTPAADGGAPFQWLEVLDMSCCDQPTITDEAVVAASSEHLRELRVAACGQLTDAAFRRLSPESGMLHTVDISDCGRLTNARCWDR